MTNDMREVIQYHIDNGFMMTIDRCSNDKVISIEGFPICFSEDFILSTVIVDFHDEGYTILRTKDIIDAYSNESDSFVEQICIAEGLQQKIHQNFINEISAIKQILLQLKDYNGFICIQCEHQEKKCSFYMGKILNVQDGLVQFRDIDMFGEWDKNTDVIPFDEITQITFGDNYSKMYYKYMKNKC